MRAPREMMTNDTQRKVGPSQTDAPALDRFSRAEAPTIAPQREPRLPWYAGKERTISRLYRTMPCAHLAKIVGAPSVNALIGFHYRMRRHCYDTRR